MKKLCLLLAAAMLAATFAACGASSSSVSSSEAAHVDGTLEELMEKVYEGIGEDEMPMVGNTELTADNSVYYTGVESTEYTEGLASEAMIGSIAHSVVLLRAEDEAAAETLKEDVKANVDPRKWICVKRKRSSPTTSATLSFSSCRTELSRRNCTRTSSLWLSK